MEIEVAEWKWGDVTDENWIPQHRILYFRRKSDGKEEGEKMWDRSKRIDRFFGSGLGIREEVMCEKREVGRENEDNLNREELSEGPNVCVEDE